MRPLLITVSVLGLLACSSDPQPAAAVERLFPDQRSVLAELVARADSDGDGALSRAEYERYENGRDPFIDVDRDGDGRLDLDEIERGLRHTDPGFYNNASFNAPSGGEGPAKE